MTKKRSLEFLRDEKEKLREKQLMTTIVIDDNSYGVTITYSSKLEISIILCFVCFIFVSLVCFRVKLVFPECQETQERRVTG